MAAPASASASATSATSPAASPSPPSSTHLLYRDVLQSVLSWLPLSEVWPARSVCAGWAAAVRGECDARPLRQKAELSAALSMLSEEAEVTAGAKRLTRLIRSVPTEDWPRSRELLDALYSYSTRMSLVSLLSYPCTAVATAAALALIAATTHAKMMAVHVVDALCTLVCGPTWNDAAALMSVDERAQLCCLLARGAVFHKQSHADRPQMFAFLLQCAEVVSEPQLRTLLRARVIPPLCAPLQRPDATAAAILQSLSALTRFLAMGKSDASSDPRLNPVADAIERCGGLDAIEELQHHANDAVYRAAVACLSEFFAYEDDDAENVLFANVGQDEGDVGEGVDFEQ